MSAQGWLQIALYLAVLTALTPLLGGYMARVYSGERVLLTPLVAPVERLLYRLLRVDPAPRTGLEGPTRAPSSSSAPCSGSSSTRSFAPRGSSRSTRTASTRGPGT